MLCQGVVTTADNKDVPPAVSASVCMVDFTACTSSGSGSASSEGILESIERCGGSVADDVSFSAVVQRIFTKTVRGTE